MSLKLLGIQDLPFDWDSADAAYLLSVYIYYTETQLATREYLNGLSKFPKRERERQDKICEGMLLALKKMNVSMNLARSLECGRVAEALDAQAKIGEQTQQ